MTIKVTCTETWYKFDSDIRKEEPMSSHDRQEPIAIQDFLTILSEVGKDIYLV